MTCLQCGGEMTTARENFKYDAAGLPGITLVGVDVSRCPNCGEYEVSIPSIEGLHRSIAHALVYKRGRLTAAEIRFLRKSLGWSGVDFAAHMGVAPETVSRWETGAATMGAQGDRLLRLMVLSKEPVRDYSLEMLKDVAQDDASPLRLGMRSDKDGWHVEAA
jgi:putative zinc finger/helix-turn-helix YgiT family protein